jgi:Reverse transcriptase (RNA-dependent DNA polymerase)
MTLSPGHEQEENSNLVCRLNKSIYGLKQSPRTWYSKLSKYLIIHYFQKKNDGKNVTIFLVYVYDLFIRNNEQEIKLIKLQFRENFDIKDLGYLKYFLEIEVAVSKKDLFISPKKCLRLTKRNWKVGI